MTFDAARKLGEACGLELPAEWVNNAIHHFCNFLPYTEIPREEAELRESAAAAGVRFSEVCGDAILDDDSTAEPCYICRKLPDPTEDPFGD